LLADLLRGHCPLRRLDGGEADALWEDVRDAAPLPDGILWRVHVPPSAACGLIDALEPFGARWLWDWGGGLVWLHFDGEARIVRAAADAAGGHAMLVRAPEAVRARVPAQHPRAAGIAAIEQRVRHGFDPAGVFEAGRFVGEARAN
jgi:glycolate oxidase FAD binding subunit